MVVAKGNSTGKLIGVFALVELLFNHLTELKDVNIAKQKVGLGVWIVNARKVTLAYNITVYTPEEIMNAEFMG